MSSGDSQIYPRVPAPTPASEPALQVMIDHLHSIHGAGIDSLLLYGSCLRSGEIFDGLLDVYVICDRYRSIYPGWFKALSNWLLPPNVFYAEVAVDERVLRCKYTVISAADFSRACSTCWFESYIWGRFAQPVSLLYSRNKDTENELERNLLRAVNTFLRRSLPLLPTSGSVQQLWDQALAHSYATELRTERAGRSGQLAAAWVDFFDRVTRANADQLGFPLHLSSAPDGLHYQSEIGVLKRRSTRLGWAVRRVQGKLMSVLRLGKALFTFEGGLDYIAWKLERHSGQEIIIPDRVRRYPLIFLWGFSWGLYRRGIFK